MTQNKYTLEPCIYSDSLLNKLAELNITAVKYKCDQVNLSLIKKGLSFAKYYHSSQMRKSGEPYYSHPIIVAEMVADHIFRENAIIAALLHDTLEDTTLTLDEIEQEFNPRIAEMVDRLTRKIDSATGKKMSAGECLLKAHELGDVEVMIIKGFDRLHNMETIDYMSKEKQEKIAIETLKFILPFIQEIDKNIEMSLNIISSRIIFPNNVDYLSKLYSKSFSSPNNYQLPSLNL